MSPKEGLSSQVELSYTYLMVCFVVHCPVLIKYDEEPVEGIEHALLRCFESSKWSMTTWPGFASYYASVIIIISFAVSLRSPA